MAKPKTKAGKKKHPAKKPSASHARLVAEFGEAQLEVVS